MRRQKNAPLTYLETQSVLVLGFSSPNRYFPASRCSLASYGYPVAPAAERFLIGAGKAGGLKTKPYPSQRRGWEGGFSGRRGRISRRTLAQTADDRSLQFLGVQRIDAPGRQSPFALAPSIGPHLQLPHPVHSQLLTAIFADSVATTRASCVSTAFRRAPKKGMGC